MARPDPLAEPEEAVRRVYRYVAHRLGDGAEAEDAASETIERALRYRDSFDPRRGSAAAWLIGIASNVVTDHLRERSREAAGDGQVPEEAERSDLAATVAERDELRAALQRLDERSRELLALRYGADLKAREIGELVGMQTKAVEMALHRALARLRTILDGGAGAAVSAETDEPLPAPARRAP